MGQFVVLMLENRSFDSLLGKLYQKSGSFEGLAGNEQNPDVDGAPMKLPCGSPILIPVSYGPISTRSYSATPPQRLVRRRPWTALSKIISSNSDQTLSRPTIRKA